MATANLISIDRNAQGASARKGKRTTQQPDFDPIFTDEQVCEFEKKYNGTWGAKRRLTMITLARSTASLAEGFGNATDNGDAMVSLIDHITDYRDHLKSSVELAECAIARLRIVGKNIAKGGAQ